MGREQLWMSYQGNRDLATRDKIIESYLPLVKKIVGRMSLKLPSHWDNEDVISYGIIGLLEAVERFIPAKGVKFETFATLRIRGAILSCLILAFIIAYPPSSIKPTYLKLPISFALFFSSSSWVIRIL